MLNNIIGSIDYEKLSKRYLSTETNRLTDGRKVKDNYYTKKGYIKNFKVINSIIINLRFLGKGLLTGKTGKK